MNRERSFCLHFVVVTGVPEVIPLAAVVVVLLLLLLLLLIKVGNVNKLRVENTRVTRNQIVK